MPSLLALIALSLAVRAFAESTSTPALPETPGFLGGMEVELTETHLGNVSPYFDLAEAKAEKGMSLAFNSEILGRDPSFFDDYLRDSPRALEGLPAELRTKLIAGLRLESLVLKDTLQPKPSLILPGLQSGAGPSSPVPITKPLSLNTAKDDTPKGPPSLMHERGGVLVPARSDWQTLYERWAALPFHEKAALVDWELLSPKHKGKIMYFIASVASASLKLKGSLQKSDPAAHALLSRLDWFMDGDALEFVHANPVSSPAQLFDDLTKFGRMAGVEQKILNNEASKITGMSFHYHMSVQGKDYGNGLAAALNDHWMVQRVAQGIISDLKGGEYVHDRELNERGLIRMHGSDRIETRSHPLPLREAMAKQVEWMSLPEAEGVRRIEAASAELLTEETVNRFFRHNPAKLARLESVLKPEHQKRFADYLRGTAAAYEGASREERHVIARAWRDSSDWSPRVWKIMVDLKEDSFFRDVVYSRALYGLVTLSSRGNERARLPAEVWEIMPKLLLRAHELDLQPNSAGGYFGKLVRALRRVREVPPSFRRALPSVLASLPRQEAREIELELSDSLDSQGSADRVSSRESRGTARGSVMDCQQFFAGAARGSPFRRISGQRPRSIQERGGD